ncbi:phosphoribosylanthranilate isomerase [Robertmurraya korlensis]|uniref:phosphoribosylanthranilate isomerase n=1 Tax=Robertmurraya korlensis TaxID=519977 RepID=UPI000825152C|nr:phosphoribosylanthranilate isomerase [Robertmurraya korlensis]
MKVKICGITDIHAAKVAVEAGADAIGFVFADSKRKVTINQAKAIIDTLPTDVRKVGVFVNEDIETIQDIIDMTGLTMVQLHGDEDPETCKKFSVPVIKALGVSSKKDCEKIQEYPCEYILLDSPKGKYRGGNGETFPWEMVDSEALKGKKLIVAGGLNINNVSLAIQSLHPFMVDVSSGVETNGKKDDEKMIQFLSKAKMGTGEFCQ